ADGDFVDGDFSELVQLGFAETTRKRAGLDVLDGVPTDLQVLGDAFDRHVPGQFQGVALEAPGVPLAEVGESHLHLPGPEADKTKHARHLEAQLHRLAADRQRPKSTLLTSVGPDVGVAAVGTTQAFARLFNANGHPTALKGLADVTVADHTEGMIQ